ncbi:MAG: polyribonucleotide nucleotidyltransferase [Prevotella sp.]
MSASDITDALQQQSIEASPGKLGESSGKHAQSFEYVLKYPGRYTTPEEYSNIVVKSTPDGQFIRLKDVADVSLGSEVYVQVMLLSADGVDQPDALAGFAASAAMACSDIPFDYTISEVRVARVNGEYVVNPTFQQMADADMDLMVGATKDNIMMVEGEMKEVSEQDLIQALKVAHEAIKPMCELQDELAKELGTDKKREYQDEVNDEDLRQEVKGLYDQVYAINRQALEKQARHEAFDKIIADFLEKYDGNHSDLSGEELEEKHALAARYYEDVMRDAMRRCILDEGVRLDGRATTDIRPIWCEASPLPMPHGSALFQRGETMSLSTCTLGTKLDEKLVDGVLNRGYQRFLLHYNFPPFSTGEAKAQRGVGRREIGHGHLAWRGLKDQIPADFPYTVRLVSQILESNGSSSMATVCAGTLALMDAGVPMAKPVSGIAMGLIKNPGEEKFAILSDILGDEDHLGDMDFKTTGTKDGLTATQMDIKCDGLSFEILEKALMQAKAGREHIMGEMMKTLSEPRAEMKPQVPRIVAVEIPKEFIGAVIGPGGKIIQQMQEDTGATITIDEIDGVGKVQVSAPNKDSIDAALAKIKAIVAMPEVGEIYEGTVKSIMPYGCFVEILPGKEGLLHISEIDWKRLETVEDAGIKEGDKIQVKLLEIDPKTGKYKLSHRVLIEKPEGYVERERRPRRENNGDRRNGNHRSNNGEYRNGNGNNRQPRHFNDHEGEGHRPAEEANEVHDFSDALDHDND